MLVNTFTDYKILFELIAGYGLGGSAVALFCRVGGGIYTKAADVGADLVAKVNYLSIIIYLFISNRILFDFFNYSKNLIIINLVGIWI